MEKSKARKRWPIFTLTLVVILILVFALQQIQVVRLEDFSLNPTYGFKPWTFVTSIFLHADFWHLFFNLLGLIYFGVYLESASAIRMRNILIVFFLSGVAGNFGYLAVAPMRIGSLGASAAIFGLLGVLVFVIPRNFIPLALIWIAAGFILDPVYAIHITGLIVRISLGLYWKTGKSQGFT